MKRCLRKYFSLLLIGLTPFIISAQEELSDTLHEENNDLHIGGAEEEEIDTNPLYLDSRRDFGWSTLTDSISHIPAYETYCGWDTRNLFHSKTALDNIVDSAYFRLCYESCDFSYPAPGQLTSPFGPRWGRMHYGLDIDLETGDPVVAAFEGMVRISQYHASYGNVIVIRHNNGLETVYAHLSKREVESGDHVEAGNQIGFGGNTGRSYGSHLHFEVRYMGNAVDPTILLDPSKQQLRDWEISLNRHHFDYEKMVAESKAKTGNVSKKYHIIKSGDTLSTIARKRKTTVKTLCKLNRIKATSTIRPGQKLRYK